MKLKKIMVVIAFALLGMATVRAQDKGPNALPKFVIQSLTHDFGEVKPGTLLKYSFVFKNQGKADLMIQSVTPGCGCTTSDFDKVVPPGKEGKITLQIEHTENYAGEIAKSAQVVTNDPTNQSFNLLIRAYFKTDQPSSAAPAIALAGAGRIVGPFSVSPSDRWVTSVLTGSSSTGTLSLYNGSGSPVHVKQVNPGGTDFTASLQTIEDGKRYQVSIATNPSLKPGQYHQMLKILTDSKAAPEMEIDLAVTVFPKVFVTPSMMNLSQVSASADLSALNYPLIYVRKIREGGLKVNNVSSTLPFIKLTLATETEGQIYTIRITIDKSKIAGPGEYKGTIKIETNDLDTPVIEIPVQGSFT